MCAGYCEDMGHIAAITRAKMSETRVPGGLNSLDATRPRTLERPSISHGMEHKNASPPPPADRPSPTVFSLAASPQVFVAP